MNGPLIKLERTFLYTRSGAGSVEIGDRVIFDRPEMFETALITYGEWRREGDGTVLISDGESAVRVTVVFDHGDLVFEHCVIRESATPTRLRWRLRKPVERAEIRISVLPE